MQKLWTSACIMKMGIIGPAERASVWEQRVRHIQSVSEVVTTERSAYLGPVDACIFLDESRNKYEKLLDLIRKSVHVFAIVPLNIDSEMALRLFRSAEESRVQVQFAHWATFTSLTEWMTEQIPNPRSLYFSRVLPRSVFLGYQTGFNHLWLEDIALCLSWISSEVHRIETIPVRHGGEELALHLHIRFDNGATGTVYVSTLGSDVRHERMASDNKMSIQANVLENHVRLAHVTAEERLAVEQKKIEQREPASTALLRFIKSIQMRLDPPFSVYHLLRLSRTLEGIQSQLTRY